MSAGSETNFCCLCLNIEVKFWKIDRKTANILKRFLNSQCLDDSLYKNICMVCYTLLLKSIKFKEQCLEARRVYVSMVHVSQELLKMLYNLNFKPNLRQTQVKLLNVDAFPSQSESTDPVIPTLEELNVVFKEEILENESVLGEDFKPNLTQTQVKFLNVSPYLLESNDPVTPAKEEVNEDGRQDIVRKKFFIDEEFQFIQEDGLELKDNLLRDLNVVKNDKIVIEIDKHTPATLMCLTDKVLDEEINAKEEYSDSNHEENVDIADVDSDDDAPLKKVLKSEDRTTLDEIDIGSPARKHRLNEVPPKAKRNKLHESTNAILKIFPKNNCKASDTRISKILSVTSNVKMSKSKQILKSKVNNYKVTKTSPDVNIEVQPKNAIEQNNETLHSKVSYNTAKNEILKECLLKRTDAFPPSTSLDRIDEGYKSNICNKMATKNDFSCPVCHTNFFTKINLDVHLRVHTGEKVYICDICNYRYTRKESLRQHIKLKHTKVWNFTCHICQYKCVAKSVLNIHLRKHTGEKPYICGLCNVRCARKGDLTTHIKRKHTLEKNFSCHVCQYKCIAKSAFDIHLRKHTGEKPYKCDLCSVRCARRSDLLRHIKRKHTMEKNFSCHICQYKCMLKSILDIHLRIHTGEKPYICDLCNVRYARKADLTTHIKFTHTKEVDYSCHICEYKCVSKSALDMHLRKHTGEKPYKCDLCNVRCARKGDFLRHIKRKHTME